MARNDDNFQYNDWELLFEFTLDLKKFYTYDLSLVFKMFESISSTTNQKQDSRGTIWNTRSTLTNVVLHDRLDPYTKF